MMSDGVHVRTQYSKNTEQDNFKSYWEEPHQPRAAPKAGRGGEAFILLLTLQGQQQSPQSYS